MREISPTSTSAIVCSTKRYVHPRAPVPFPNPHICDRLQGTTTNTPRRFAPASSVVLRCESSLACAPFCLCTGHSVYSYCFQCIVSSRPIMSMFSHTSRRHTVVVEDHGPPNRLFGGRQTRWLRSRESAFLDTPALARRPQPLTCSSIHHLNSSSYSPLSVLSTPSRY